MNFLCDKCKQKYHVADDKLRGRAVTRFRCKKCDNVIELQAPAPEVESAPSPSSSSMPAAVASVRPATGAMPAARAPAPARPRPSTSSGPAFGASAFGALRGPTGTPSGPKGPAAGFGTDASRANQSPAMSASESGWYAGIRDLPVGPLTRKELATRVHAGDVTPETLVWREGLDDWRPLRNIAELGDLLRPAPAKPDDEAARRPAAAPRGAQVVPIGASRSAMSRPSIAEDDDDEATRVAGMDPALAGLVARNMPPSDRPAERPRSSPAPAPAAEKPVAKAPTAPAAPAARTPMTPLAKAPAAPVARPLAAPSTRASAPPPAPPAAARAASLRPPAPAPEKPAEKPAQKPVETAIESTVPSLDEMFSNVPASKTAAAAPVVATPSKPPEPEMVAAPAAPATAPEKPAVTLAETSGTLPGPPPAADEDLPEDLFAKPVAATRAAPVTVPVTAPVVAAPIAMPEPVFMPPPAPQTPVAVPVAAAPAQRGLPASAWVLMAGVLVVGIGGGIYIGRMNHPQPQPDVQPPPRPSRPVEPTPPVVPQPAAVADAAPPAPDVPAPSVDAGATTEPARDTPRDHAHADHADRGAHVPAGLTPAELARLAAESRNAASGPQLTGPVGNTQPRDTQANAQPQPGQSPAQRGGAIMRNFENSHVVGTCWQATLRQNPALRTTGVTIDVGVDGRGRYSSVDVNGAPDPRFTACLRARLGSILPVGPGEAMAARTSVTLTVNN